MNDLEISNPFSYRPRDSNIESQPPHQIITQHPGSQPTDIPEPVIGSEESRGNEDFKPPISPDPPPITTTTPSPVQRSTRERKAPDYYSPVAMSFFHPTYVEYLSDFGQMSIHDTFLVHNDLAMVEQYNTFAMIATDDHDTDIIHYQHPFAFSAQANSTDTPTFNEAMNGPDRDGFQEAMNA